MLVKYRLYPPIIAFQVPFLAVICVFAPFPQFLIKAVDKVGLACFWLDWLRSIIVSFAFYICSIFFSLRRLFDFRTTDCHWFDLSLVVTRKIGALVVE